MTDKVELIVDGGVAAPGPQMAQSFGPLGVNMQAVIQEINKKTHAFAGMKVPIIVIIKEDKSFEVEVGVPGASELIKKEISLEKGSGKQAIEKVGNLGIEQIIKIAKLKYQGMLVNNLRSAVKSIVGSCQSMGILIEGREAKQIAKDIDAGRFDKEIKQEISEISKDKLMKLKEDLVIINAEIAKELAKEQKAAEEVKAEAAKTEEKKPEEVAGKAPAAAPGKEGAPAAAKEAAPKEAKKDEKKK